MKSKTTSIRWEDGPSKSKPKYELFSRTGQEAANVTGLSMPDRFYDDDCCPPDYCTTLRRYKTCQAELERLRLELWKETEKKTMLEENECWDRMETEYQKALVLWEAHQAKCEDDRRRRKALLKATYAKLKEKKLARDDAKKKRQQEEELNRQENRRLARELEDREAERRLDALKLYMKQEDKLLDHQMKPRNTDDMKAPIMEEMRRMFAPVPKGPNEVFEYFVLEPRPTPCELRRETEEKAIAMMGLRNANGIHLNLSDRMKKKTTIQLAMGPKQNNGEREQNCSVMSYPGASW